MFSKPATKMYPFVVPEYPKATRGSIDIDIDNCIFCGLCSRKCPSGAIVVNRSEKVWEIDRFGCVVCSYCVDCCPKKCLSVNNQYTEPSSKKSSGIFKLVEKNDFEEKED
ncbi:MAG: 4Fe-4S binding protein [Oscillospiraceae bacterium]